MDMRWSSLIECFEERRFRLLIYSSSAWIRRFCFCFPPREIQNSPRSAFVIKCVWIFVLSFHRLYRAPRNRQTIFIISCAIASALDTRADYCLPHDVCDTWKWYAQIAQSTANTTTTAFRATARILAFGLRFVFVYREIHKCCRHDNRIPLKTLKTNR